MKRLFIGCQVISESAFQFTEDWKENAALNGNVVKWTKPENWHITLIFLGVTPVSSINLLQNLVEEAFQSVPSFHTRLNGVGIFPNWSNPKVLWLGLTNIEPLVPARLKLVNLLPEEGFPIDNKPFKAHLTLARIKHAANRTALKTIVEQYQNFDFGTVIINSVILYESISTADGPVYKPIYRKELLDL